MAHVGFRWPIITARDFKLYMSSDGGYSVPRRWRLRNLGPTHGTLAAPWLDLEFNSEVFEIASDRQSISWKFPHPDDSDDYVLLVLSWFEHDTLEHGSQHNNMWWRFRGEYWNHGTKFAGGLWKEWGDSQSFRGDYAGMGLGNGAPPTTNPWIGCIDLAQFRNMGSTRLRCSLWPEQPDYHPYRHTP